MCDRWCPYSTQTRNAGGYVEQKRHEVETAAVVASGSCTSICSECPACNRSICDSDRCQSVHTIWEDSPPPSNSLIRRSASATLTPLLKGNRGVAEEELKHPRKHTPDGKATREENLGPPNAINAKAGEIERIGEHFKKSGFLVNLTDERGEADCPIEANPSSLPEGPSGAAEDKEEKSKESELKETATVMVTTEDQGVTERRTRDVAVNTGTEDNKELLILCKEVRRPGNKLAAPLYLAVNPLVKQAITRAAEKAEKVAEKLEKAAQPYLAAGGFETDDVKAQNLTRLLNEPTFHFIPKSFPDKDKETACCQFLNNMSIRNKNGDILLNVLTQPICCATRVFNCCASIALEICTTDGRCVAKMESPAMPCVNRFLCCCCAPQEAGVFLFGNFIGSIHLSSFIFTPKFDVLNGQHQPVFKILGPCQLKNMICCTTCEPTYFIVDAEKKDKSKIGSIRRRKEPCCLAHYEIAPVSTELSCNNPSHTLEEKILLIAVDLMIEHLWSHRHFLP